MAESNFPNFCLFRLNWSCLRVVQARSTYVPGLKRLVKVAWALTEGYCQKLWAV